MLTSGRPNRRTAHHPNPASTPAITITTTRRDHEAALTPAVNEPSAYP
ncbi:hypothetical protein [Amycolatopsis sp. CA-230715]|nr:hypothetical protein [Amycolatopsis sp. CA-230715]